MAVPDIKQNYEIYRGDTWVSRKYIFIKETLPPDITKKELEDGIANGKYHAIDLREYDIQADVKIDDKLWFTLTDYIVISDSGRYMNFALTPTQSRTLFDKPLSTQSNFIFTQPIAAKPPRVGVYDIQFKKTKGTTPPEIGFVKTMWSGQFQINPDITEREDTL